MTAANRPSPIRQPRSDPRQRGAAAILAMMFLVIFAALATAMAIVAQGNFSTADANLKINRSLATAETGLQFLMYRINQAAQGVRTRAGLIDDNNAPALWYSLRAALRTAMSGEPHNAPGGEPYDLDNGLHLGPIQLGSGADALTFTATLRPHPLAGENYDAPYYQRPPYSTMSPPVSSADPLDATWVRVRVEAYDGPAQRRITRALQMDFKLDKKIRFAILSRSRVMIGPNVMIEGAVGSGFMETDLANGHPVQMASDFEGLDAGLDSELATFRNTLAVNDRDGDNRLNLLNASEVANIDNPGQYDLDGDGFVTDFDFFLGHYDTQGKGYVTAGDLDTAHHPRNAQLFALIDNSGDPERPGFGDGKLDADDRYAKVHGQVMITATFDSWQNGAAQGAYQDYFQGPLLAEEGDAPLTFEASDNDLYQFTPADFDVSSFRSLASGDLAQQVRDQGGDPDHPTRTFESVPFGAAHPYDYYDRPVFENMTFTNVRIPRGTNALFRNCTFIGCTFIETTPDADDPNFSYAGMQEADASPKYPGATASVEGVQVTDTKTVANNIRFDGCTFEGAVVSDVPNEFSQVRNKVTFTGATRFAIQDSQHLDSDQKELFTRSTILAPHYSVEMGTFIDPDNPNETVDLSGTIVAGIIDLRGQVKVNGTILTTFEPQSDTGPVVGQTSPQFNTTLGYFGSAQGDMEAEVPGGGMGRVRVRYDPTIPLPDGILGPIELRPDWHTYCETGAQ